MKDEKDCVTPFDAKERGRIRESFLAMEEYEIRIEDFQDFLRLMRSIPAPDPRVKIVIGEITFNFDSPAMIRCAMDFSESEIQRLSGLIESERKKCQSVDLSMIETDRLESELMRRSRIAQRHTSY